MSIKKIAIIGCGSAGLEAAKARIATALENIEMVEINPPNMELPELPKPEPIDLDKIFTARHDLRYYPKRGSKYHK